ncbi:hypothetical protein EJ02DRAFT_430200 [Clathrospora elynae]|uniref:MINDY deubiquitinase domain-containing protein n=1 Tax=Clathrospora elynae TaxID=706981 RepID=A0A6A5TDL1_9PLEO|nr:hypothetical protein EJ02DRAFT_430200 [Clathrospora elynae]
MVLRRSEEQDSLVPAPLSKANPPYPTTPSDEHPPALHPPINNVAYSPNPNRSPAFGIKTPERTSLLNGKHDIDSDFSDDDEWNQSDDDFEDVDPQNVPDALRPAGGKAPSTNNSGRLPDALRAGSSAGVPIKQSLENILSMPTGASSASYGAMSTVSEQSNGSIPLKTNNPYLKMQTTGQSSWDGESSEAIWGDTPKYEPVELPAYQSPSTPEHEMQNLKLDSDAPPLQSSNLPDPPPSIAVNSPTPRSEHPVDTIVSNPWEPDHASFESGPHMTSAPEVGAHDAEKAPHLPPPIVEEQAPALPPRRSHEETSPATPPMPIDTGVGSAAAPGVESPITTMNRQRKEHYQIKHIRWHDDNIKAMRTSPILTQNLNGPCPLLALVNALVLSTPANLETALVETLRTRETVSLGLLLDAVFDELMSGRRGDAAQALPDVTELYKFLLALHTGLNVNPMFVPDTNTSSGNTALTNRAGAFENTQDMKLYRTFDIPLMHGWLPEAGSEAYSAFERIAPSYETSQFVQFQEEELDAKLQAGESLNDDEQQMFTDIHAIKEFLGKWPTQLTDHGLNVIRNTLPPGQVAILFRNDHFSMLCKDGKDRLFTLVTDQGYSTHDEIVWESLTDVNGQGSQLYSGDFRSVDNSNPSSEPQQQQNVDDGQEWTTVQGRRGNQQQLGVEGARMTSQDAEPTSPGALSRAEQEDHDLALALQLQEEEEDRERRETEQRARDNQLSMDAIATQNQAPRPAGNRRASRPEQTPVIPPRRNNVPTQRPNQVTTHRPNTESAPPPTYEEASTAPRYNPPAGHPASSQAPLPYNNNNALPPPGAPNQGRRHSGRPIPTPTLGLPNRLGRRQSAGTSSTETHGDEREKCVVM